MMYISIASHINQRVYCLFIGSHDSDSIWHRLRDVRVTASIKESDIFYSGNDEFLCYYYQGTLSRYYNHMTCRQPIRAQFVQIQLFVNQYLHVYEIEVHGA